MSGATIPVLAYAPAARAEPRVVRGVLIGIAGVFLALFLFLPLAAVFAQALEKGIAAYFAALADPDARAAIRLTMIVTAIVVPLNVVFGIAAAWAIAKFEFRGKSVLL